jgi:hypothetical protein
MPKIIQISVPPEKSFEEEYIFHLALSKSGLYESDVKDWYIKKRSVDARKRPVKIQLAVALFEKGEEIVSPLQDIVLSECGACSHNRSWSGGNVCSFSLYRTWAKTYRF